MYSVKPGRGPSMMGVVGGIAAAAFGIFWTIGASSAGAPPAMALFGVVFVILAVGSVGYNLFNATSRDRMSSIDITTGDEETDPIARALGHVDPPQAGRAHHVTEPDEAGEGPRKYPGSHCPFCGAKVEDNFDYCPECGRDI